MERSDKAFSELQDKKDSLDREVEKLRSELKSVQAENETLRTAQPVTEFELPEAADALNKLKAEYKKTKRKELLALKLADMEAILGIIKGLTPDRGN